MDHSARQPNVSDLIEFRDENERFSRAILTVENDTIIIAVPQKGKRR
jgi:hypothetical protein